MIDHLIVTVSEFERSKAFYERALAPLGMTAKAEFPSGPPQARGVGFGGEDNELFVVEGSPIKPPVHVAFRAPTRTEVRAFHRDALAAGGRDNGAPDSALNICRLLLRLMCSILTAITSKQFATSRNSAFARLRHNSVRRDFCVLVSSKSIAPRG